jgi:hypothetical protein
MPAQAALVETQIYVVHAGTMIQYVPPAEASSEQQQRQKSLPIPTSLYYDGDTQPFSMSKPVIVSTPTVTTSEPAFSPPSTQTKNNNKNIKKSKKNKKKEKRKQRKR